MNIDAFREWMRAETLISLQESGLAKYSALEIAALKEHGAAPTVSLLRIVQDAICKAFEGAKTVEYVERLPSIHVPTLIVVGDHDECEPSLSKEMHEKIAGSQLVILPNSGHMNFVDQPDLWYAAVDQFLAK